MTGRLLRNIAAALRQNAVTIAADRERCKLHWEALEQQRLELTAIAQEVSSRAERAASSKREDSVSSGTQHPMRGGRRSGIYERHCKAI